MVLRLVLCAVTAFPSILKLGWEVRRRDRCPQLGEYRTREADARRRVCAELRCANSIKHVAREGVGSKKNLSLFFGDKSPRTSHAPYLWLAPERVLKYHFTPPTHRTLVGTESMLSSID